MTAPRFETVVISPELSARVLYTPEKNLPTPWIHLEFGPSISGNVDATPETAAMLRTLADDVETAWNQKTRFDAALASLPDQA